MKMTFRVIVIGGLIVFFAVVTVAVFVPGLIWTPEQTVKAVDYSTDEEAGRELFYSNGCNYCHTQYVREQDTAMGDPSEGGDYVFDNPMILGSERTGPDLSNIGHKRSEAWEYRHLDNPREMSPLSIMPSFEFLAQADKELIVTYLFSLGDKTAAERMIDPVAAYANQVDILTLPTESSAASDQPRGWDSWNAAQLQDGKELYVSRCLTCHGCAGNGLGSYGGTLSVTPANFKVDPYRSMADDEFFWHISEGIPGTVMPTWKASMTEDEIWNVVRYIQQIFAKPMMHDPDEGDPSGSYADLTNPLDNSIEILDEGKAIFIRECMICHGDAGRGNGLYGTEIQPGPPDFGDGSYGDYTDSDYFWRISEGVPWTAMPAWKIEYSEVDRWKLVHYIRTIFTQTEDGPTLPVDGENFTFPEFYQTSMTLPEDASYERGKIVFITQCAHCHGAAGDGQGVDGQYLTPTPADFRTLATLDVTPEVEGAFIARVTYGIQGTAMPKWGEFLTLGDRWDVLKFIFNTFTGSGMSDGNSVYTDQIPVNFLTLSSDVYVSEGYTITPSEGEPLFATYCATCHGDSGEGMGTGTEGSASTGPAAFPSDLSETYLFWRIWEGVPGSPMAPYQWVFNHGDVWNLTTYLVNLTSSTQGGQQ